MRLTTFDPRDAGADHLMPAGHFPSADLGADDVLELMAGLTMPGGGLWSTPDDVLRFGRAMLLGGALDGARVLERRTLEAMTEPQTSGVSDFGSGEPVSCGLGWGLRPAGAGASAFAHSGATGSMLIVDPDAELVVVHLRNWWGVAMDATTKTVEAVYASLDG
jgi:CubicO group peptidase (beta-lactamase class C family)